MNFQQLRAVREAVRRDFNLTAVAAALHTSQPGVSRQIGELEDELGVQIFERRGKRLAGLTPPGRDIVEIVERLLGEQDNLRRAGAEHAGQGAGGLTIATTHTQARYALPGVVAAFRKRFPDVHLALQQSSPEHIAEAVKWGTADIGIATEALSRHAELLTLPCYEWRHVVVVPPRHALLSAKPVTIPQIAQYPLITYDPQFTGRPHIDEAFARHSVTPDIVLTAMDADVIKTYVEAGLGIGIIASMAFDPAVDRRLRALESAHLFASNMTRLAVRRGAYLRGYAYTFIEMFAPNWTRAAVEKLAAARGDSYEI